MSLVPYVHLDPGSGDLRSGSTVALASDDVHHLTRVLRLRAGAELVVADGRGNEAGAVLDGGQVLLTTDVRSTAPPSPRLVVAQALAKGRKLDEVVRQVAELGADAVVPVAAERCVVRLDDDRAAKATGRWRAVARAAAEQSRRPWRAEVAPVTPVGELPVVAGDGEATTLLVAVPGAAPLPRILADLPGLPAAVTIAIGPEGGWTDEEVATLAGAGALAVGLGTTVLRTEHAAAAAVAVLGATLGRWG